MRFRCFLKTTMNLLLVTVLPKRTAIDEMIPFEDLAIQSAGERLELRSQPLQPGVVSVSTEAKAVMAFQVAVQLPRNTRGVNLALLDGANHSP